MWPWTLPAAPSVWARRTVYIVYRRGMAELPARKEEVEHAEEEGIIFKTLCNPVEILGDENGFVKRHDAASSMELGEPDASGRRRPVVKKGSEFTHGCGHCDHGHRHQPQPAHPLHHPGPGDQQAAAASSPRAMSGLTSREGVYAGGDAVTGAATVILAMGAGKTAAKAIDEYIQSK